MKKYIIATVLLMIITYQIHSQTIMIKHTSYEICFDTILRQPKWTHYILTGSKLVNVTRRTIFQQDKLLSIKYQCTVNDYVKSSWDRGHLAPNNDFRYNIDAQKESMLYTNCAPQNRTLNRGMWKSLEVYVSKLASKYNVEIWTGCIYDNCKRRSGKLIVPTHFWKLLKYDNKYEAYLIENTNVKGTFKQYATTSDKLLILINK